MTKTFTQLFDITEKKTKHAKMPLERGQSEPSAQTIQNILNYSKNLEVLPSRQLPFVEIVKS